MSNDRPDRTSLVPVSEMQQLAGMLAKSRLLPQELIGKEADIAVTVMAGRELGLAPMAALRGIHVVKGKPVLSADTMVAIALSTGAAEYFRRIDSTSSSATYETKRRGEAPQRLTFTIEQARAANLIKNGGNWEMYPEAMLRARCKAALARDVYPDALAGCYEESEREELEREELERGGGFSAGGAGGARVTPGDVIDASFEELKPEKSAVDLAAAAAPMLAEIEAAGSVEQLRLLAPRVNALPKGTEERQRAKDAYLARMDYLTAQAATQAAAQGAA